MKMFQGADETHTLIDMKMFEILNQVKATLENCSPEQAWSSLGPEIEDSPRAVRRALNVDYSEAEARKWYMKIIDHVSGNYEARLLKETTAPAPADHS